MADVAIDTHVAIWYFVAPQNLSVAATAATAAAEATGTIYVSAVTIIELIYLVEKGRIPKDVLDLLRAALDDPTTAFRLVEINRVVADAVEMIPRSVVTDMPDRIIAATALHFNLPLVTRDPQIKNFGGLQTIW
jgi:PIN domain nuclease of toxin-antitoxin system